MSLDSSEEIDKFLSNSCFINPNIFYPEGWKKNCKSYKFPSGTSLFTKETYSKHIYSIGKTKVIGFYKNGYKSKSDLFSKAIAADLNSSIAVQYYG